MKHDRFLNGFIVFLPFCVALTSCASKTAYAPVVNLSPPASQIKDEKAPAGTYRVQQGDTAYSIAWANGLDYRSLKNANHLPSNYEIHPGQLLNIKPNAAPQHVEAQKKPSRSPVHVPHIKGWQWPARGLVAKGFSTKPFGNKGVNISGRRGQTIHAAQKGRVVYSGAGIRGYGNLIIIKHNESYLSAYAFNQRNLVHQGDSVAAGEKIALMGRNHRGRAMLHFELRKNGKPVNPAYYLH